MIYRSGYNNHLPQRALGGGDISYPWWLLPAKAIAGNEEAPVGAGPFYIPACQKCLPAWKNVKYHHGRGTKPKDVLVSSILPFSWTRDKTQGCKFDPSLLTLFFFLSVNLWKIPKMSYGMEECKILQHGRGTKCSPSLNVWSGAIRSRWWWWNPRKACYSVVLKYSWQSL